MGEVYLAQDTVLGRQVALKVVLPEVAADPVRRARFESEARAIAALNHPNIVTVHAVERGGDVHFIAMEYVSGRPLSAVIPAGGGLALRRFLELAIPLVDAVAAAHQHGITHRDLKPDNVMVTEEGRVKVLDFGLAKLKPALDDSETVLDTSPAVTTEGQVLGTVAYMSPEQTEGKPLDHRSDIFSLGVVMFEMATGRRPFAGDSAASLISAILRDDPAPVSQVNPSIPSTLARVIQRCLAKDPSRRYQSAFDIRNELLELQQALDSGVVPGAQAAVRRQRSLWPIVAALGVAAAVVSYMWRGREGPAGAAPLAEATFAQLTHAAGQELFPSLSPDGKTIVYAGSSGGTSDIYSQRVGGENAVNLTASAAVDESQPAYSPDGEHIAFRAEREGGGIFVMGATGEAVRRLTSDGYHPSWSPDGQHIVYVTQNVTDPAMRFSISEMWVVTVSSGERRLLSEGDAAQPSWSPHGLRIAYWARSTTGGPGDIFTIPAGGGAPVAVTTEPSIDWNPVWSPDGAFLYFASDRGGNMNLWRAPIDENTGAVLGAAVPLTTGGGAASQHITIARDGKRLAYVSRTEATNVQRVAFDHVKGARAGAPEWVTRGSRAVAQPDPSPDGTRVSFNSLGRQEDIFVASSDGSGTQQLTDDPFEDRASRWAPDGQRIAFYSNRTGKYEIWTINRDGSGLQQLTHHPGAHYPVWSPDGAQMAYSTHSPNGAFIFNTKVPWADQRSRPLPAIADNTQTFEIWSWSPDGRYLAGQKHLTDLSHAGIAIHEIGSPQIRWLSDIGEWPVWLRDNRRLLFSHRGTLYLIDSVSGVRREVLSLPQNSLGSVGVSADNRTIYFTVRAAEADVWLMTMK